MSVHPDDILVVGTYAERVQYPTWPERQVITVGRMDRLRGSRVRNVYYSPLAGQFNSDFWSPSNYDEVKHQAQRSGGFVRSIEFWTPEATTLLDQIAALPEQAASSSRDFGRGYALAIRDVLALLGAQQ